MRRNQSMRGVAPPGHGDPNANDAYKPTARIQGQQMQMQQMQGGPAAQGQQIPSQGAMPGRGQQMQFDNNNQRVDSNNPTYNVQL